MKKTISLLLSFVFIFALFSACGSERQVASNIQTVLPGRNETNDKPLDKVIDNDPEKTVIKFLAVGDVLIHESIFVEAQTFASQSSSITDEYYFDPMYEKIAEKVSSADIAFVNHETPIGGKALGISGYPNFNAPEESGDALVRLGFDVVNISNNHMLDADGKGTGYANTIDYWSTKSVLQIGGYRNSDDYNTPRVLTSKGVTIAFLSYTYGTNGMTLNSSSSSYVVPLINDSVITSQIERAKTMADLVFVSMHWGNENVFTPTGEQKRLAKLIADCGADVIIGHHSHTVQPVEWLTGSSGNQTLCIYSLGNLISTMLNSYNMVGGMMTFDIVKEGENRPYITNPVMEATVCHYTADQNRLDRQGLPTRSNIKIYMFKDYSEALAKQHGAQLQGAFTLDTLKGYVSNTVSSEFLPFYLK